MLRYKTVIISVVIYSLLLFSFVYSSDADIEIVEMSASGDTYSSGGTYLSVSVETSEPHHQIDIYFEDH